MTRFFAELGGNWTCLIQPCERFDRLRARPFVKGVQKIVGRVKGTGRWEIQGYKFMRAQFNTPDECCTWLNTHLKGEIRTCLDFKAWNEYRRQTMNVFLQIAEVHSDK